MLLKFITKNPSYTHTKLKFTNPRTAIFLIYYLTTSHIEFPNFGDTLKGFRSARASALLRWAMKNNKTEVET